MGTLYNETNREAGNIYWNLLVDTFIKVCENTAVPMDEFLLFACGLLARCAKLCIHENPLFVKKDLDTLAHITVKIIDTLGKPFPSKESALEKYYFSFQGEDELLSLFLHAITDAGPDGLIEIEKSRDMGNHYQHTFGHYLHKGYGEFQLNGQTDNDALKFENSLIALAAIPIITVEDILPLFTAAAKAGKPLIIVAEYMEDKPKKAFIQNVVSGGLRGAFIPAPRYGTQRQILLEDMSLITGSIPITNESGGFARSDGNFLGSADSVIVHKDYTVFHQSDDDRIEKVENRLQSIKQIGKDVDKEKEKFQDEREALLNRNTIMISVGGMPAKQNFWADKLKNSLNQYRTDMQYGVIESHNVFTDIYNRLLSRYSSNGQIGKIVMESLKELSFAEHSEKYQSCYAYVKGMTAAFDIVSEMISVGKYIQKIR